MKVALLHAKSIAMRKTKHRNDWIKTQNSQIINELITRSKFAYLKPKKLCIGESHRIIGFCKDNSDTIPSTLGLAKRGS